MLEKAKIQSWREESGKRKRGELGAERRTFSES